MSVYRIVENGKIGGKIGAEFHLYDLLLDGIAIERDAMFGTVYKKVAIKIMPGDVYQEAVGNNAPYVEIGYDTLMADLEATRKFDRGE